MHIHSLDLLAADISAQHTFYAHVLGLPAAHRTPETLEIVSEQWSLTFRAAPPGWHGIYHFAFNIPENQFDAAKSWLAARVALNTGPDGIDTFYFEDWNAHAVYCTDPAGNIVELIARHTLPNASEAPFSGDQLLAISEIGLVVENVPAAVQALQEEMDIPIYRGAGNPDFTAVGDEEGLLIVVRRGRRWFSDSSKPAEALPTKMTISSSDGERHTLSGPPWHILPSKRVTV